MKNLECLFTRRPGIIGEEKYSQFAVFVPLIEKHGEVFLLFEKRSGNLKRQPGEICFPGGRIELGETAEECAVRETTEELLIVKEQIRVLGASDIFLSPFQLVVYPYIGILSDYGSTFSKDEVEEILEIPISFFLENEPRCFKAQLLNHLPEGFPFDLIPDGENYKFARGNYEILFYQYGEHTIWGMTAQMAKNSITLLQKYEIL
ncbi:MAG: NUDIX hydrolase [Lachnospiraceae bacterium]